MIFEWDDFGCDHVISDMCQSHDCRDQLLRLKKVNPDFKATLFAVPAEMTMELLQWCKRNGDWIELAVHGFGHISNYECSDWSAEQMGVAMASVAGFGAFVPVFRAPGWQISDGCYEWLKENNWIVADQGYNDERRPKDLKAYVNYNGQFKAYPLGHDVGADDFIEVQAYHGHVWNVGSVGSNPNGIYEDYDNVEKLVREAKTFQFVSELFV